MLFITARNLRILKHALNDFKKIFDMVNKNYPNTNQVVLQTMLIFTIAVSFEIKAGKITKDKFINFFVNNFLFKNILSSTTLVLSYFIPILELITPIECLKSIPFLLSMFNPLIS